MITLCVIQSRQLTIKAKQGDFHAAVLPLIHTNIQSCMLLQIPESTNHYKVFFASELRDNFAGKHVETLSQLISQMTVSAVSTFSNKLLSCISDFSSVLFPCTRVIASSWIP